MSELYIALDRASVRRVDEDGHLHVELTPVTKANVCPYMGREIPGWRDFKLTADRIYQLYRDPAELEKAIDSFNGKPVFMGHRPVGAADHDHQNNVGAMTGATWQAPYIMAQLDIWPQTAIDAIENKNAAELSAAYRYVPVMEPGTTPDGTRYDGRMTKIDCSHVALVPKGRAGSDVRVHDAAMPTYKDLLMSRKPSATLSVAAVAAQVALLSYARPRIAQDAKLDLSPMLKGVTRKNIKAKASGIAKAFDAALRPNLARDAELDQAEVADIVEQIAEVVAEQSDEIAAQVDGPVPDANDAGANWSEVEAFLQGKISDEDMAELKKLFSGDDEDGAADKRVAILKGSSDELLAKLNALPKGDGRITVLKDESRMISKTAMDEAIKVASDKARDEAVTRVRAEQRAVREAEHFVRPWVGDLPVAQDSAEGVHRAALDVLGIKHEGKHRDALADIIAAQRKPGEKVGRTLASDAAPKSPAYDTTSFPNARRLKMGA